MTTSGQLDRYATLQSPSTVITSTGQEIVTWTNVVSVYASIVALTGREQMIAQQTTELMSHRITLRYRTDVNSQWRLQHNGKTYNFTSVAEVGRAQWLEIMAIEEVGA